MKKIMQGQWISPLPGKKALALATVLAYALSGNMTVHAQKITPVSPVPETGSWLIGAGVLAMLALEFLRRISARKKPKAV